MCNYVFRMKHFGGTQNSTRNRANLIALFSSISAFAPLNCSTLTFAVFSSVRLGAPLEDDVAGVVGEFGELVDAVNVDAIVVLDLAVRDQLLLLVLGPVDAAVGAAGDQLLFVLPGPVDSALMSMLEDASSLKSRVDAVLDDDNGVGSVQSQLLSVLVAVLVDVVSCDVEHATESSQFVGVVAELHHVIFNEVEHILIVNVEMQVEEERVVEH